MINKEKLPYLTEEEKKRMKMLINEIKDSLYAIENEINTMNHPYKSYLNEKLNTLKWDVPGMLNIVNGEEDD